MENYTEANSFLEQAMTLRKSIKTFGRYVQEEEELADEDWDTLIWYFSR